MKLTCFFFFIINIFFFFLFFFFFWGSQTPVENSDQLQVPTPYYLKGKHGGSKAPVHN